MPIKLHQAIDKSILKAIPNPTKEAYEIKVKIPEFTFSANAQYQLTNKFNLGFGYLSQGESLIIDDNENLTLPQYSRLDLSGSYNISDRLTLRLHLDNVLDELYFPHAHAVHQVSVGEPFNARIVFSYYF